MWLNYIAVLPWFIRCTWKGGGGRRGRLQNNITVILLAIMTSTCISLGKVRDFVTKPESFTVSTLPCMSRCVRDMEWDNLVSQVYPEGLLEAHFQGRFVYVVAWNILYVTSELRRFFFSSCSLCMEVREWVVYFFKGNTKTGCIAKNVINVMCFSWVVVA